MGHCARSVHLFFNRIGKYSFITIITMQWGGTVLKKCEL